MSIWKTPVFGLVLGLIVACAPIVANDGPTKLDSSMQSDFLRLDMKFWSGGVSPSKSAEFTEIMDLVPNACMTYGGWRACLVRGALGLRGSDGFAGLALHTDGSKCRSGLGRVRGGTKQTARLMSPQGGNMRNIEGLFGTRSDLVQVCEQLRIQ